LRHAYGSWTSSHGTLTMGHTWSTLMDLQILPEGLTEPTLSGAVFQRQAQLRWTQRVSERFRVDLAIEDPSNRDVISDAPVATPSRVPDVIGGTEFNWASRAHVRVTGIYRRVNANDLDGNGWALSYGAHVIVFGGDTIAGSLSYGNGVGRYLLGMPGTFGGFVDSAGQLNLIAGRGGLMTFRHGWTDKVRSTVGYGRARIDRYAGAPPEEFRSSTFVLAKPRGESAALPDLWFRVPVRSAGVAGRRLAEQSSDHVRHAGVLSREPQGPSEVVR